MQDLRRDLVALLDGVQVSVNLTTYTVRAGLWKDIYTLPLPAIFVRALDVTPETIGLGADAVHYQGVYDLSLIAVGRDAFDADDFLAALADAVESRLLTVTHTGLADAWAVRVVNDRQLPPVDRGGTLEYERVLTIRAHSIKIL